MVVDKTWSDYRNVTIIFGQWYDLYMQSIGFVMGTGCNIRQANASSKAKEQQYIYRHKNFAFTHCEYHLYPWACTEIHLW